MMFDYVAAAQRVGIPGDKLERLVALARAEFPDDETMLTADPGWTALPMSSAAAARAEAVSFRLQSRRCRSPATRLMQSPARKRGLPAWKENSRSREPPLSP